MNYGSYRRRKVGDRVVDKTGKSGVVTEIYVPRRGREVIAVKWDDGGPAKNLALPGQFTLLTRAAAKNEVGSIPRPTLAEMLKERMPAKHGNTDGGSQTL